jgi:hypothetical protein
MNSEPVSQPQAPTIDSRSHEASWTAALPDDFGALLRDGIDLHVHGQPDVSRRFANRGADVDVARLAHAYGLRGWVLKSHLWPTMDRAGLIRDSLTDIDFEVYGSITLNPPAGGVSVTVVELAASHDAKVIFLPTWGSAADVARGGYIPDRLTLSAPSFPRYASAHAISLTDGNGSLTGAVREALDACRALDLSVATGHAGLSESLAVAEYCAGIGARVLITHPQHYVDKPGQLTRFTDLGAFVEFCNAPLLHPDGHLTIRDVYAGLEAIGPQQAVLTTDIFSRWVPPEPECFRMFAEQLSYLGISADDIRQLIAANPRRFLGLPESASEPC